MARRTLAVWLTAVYLADRQPREQDHAAGEAAEAPSGPAGTASSQDRVAA